jgi:hypothetical protein
MHITKKDFKGLPPEELIASEAPLCTSFRNRFKKKAEGIETACALPGNINDKTAPGTNIMQTILASSPPRACTANCIRLNLVWISPVKGNVPNIAAVCALKADLTVFLSLRNTNKPSILPDNKRIVIQAEKLSRKPVLQEQNGSAAIMTKAAAAMADTVSLPAKADEDMNADLVTDSLHPVRQPMRNAKII